MGLLIPTLEKCSSEAACSSLLYFPDGMAELVVGAGGDREAGKGEKFPQGREKYVRIYFYGK